MNAEKVKISPAMREELRHARAEIRAANVEIKAMSRAITGTLRELLGDSSPFPEFREKFLAHTRQFAEAYVCGAITKREMKAKYNEAHQQLVAFALRCVWDDERARPFKDALANLTYHTIRRDAILRGETVCKSN